MPATESRTGTVRTSVMQTVNAMYSSETRATATPMAGLLTRLTAAQTRGTSAHSGSRPKTAALYTAIVALVPAHGSRRALQLTWSQ